MNEQARVLIEDMLTDRLAPDESKVSMVNELLAKDGGTVEIIHLGRDGDTRGVCSIVADGDRVSSEHNDITCPLCFCIHEAICDAGNGESEFFEHDIDSIMASEGFIEAALTLVTNRLARADLIDEGNASKTERCPDCGARVASVFDHVDIDCLNGEKGDG